MAARPLSLIHILEKGLSSMITKFDAAKGGTGIIMDVNSGAILAMASYPTYDPNSYGTLYDEKLQSQLDSQLAELAQNRADYETEEDYQAAVSAAKSSVLSSQWRNKCIDSTYEPGSTCLLYTSCLRAPDSWASNASAGARPPRCSWTGGRTPSS